MPSPHSSSDLPLVVDGVEKRFGQTQALAGASFELRQGELLGLLGPNGAGKTTVIRSIAGRVKIDRGQIRLLGRALGPADMRAELGVVPQELAIYPLLTARENLQAFGRLYGVPPSALATRVDWALEWADLKDRSRESIKKFSGGMKRRLNIACSLLHEPTVVLLDEPTAGVDPQSRERIYEMLAGLQRLGVSIVLTTHHLEEAEQRCDRVVIIDHGRVIASGTVEELKGRAGGAARVARVTVTEPWPAGDAIPNGTAIDDDRRVLRAPVADVGVDLAALLAAVATSGRKVANVDLSGASLQDVFIALTGRELRE